MSDAHPLAGKRPTFLTRTLHAVRTQFELLEQRRRRFWHCPELRIQDILAEAILAQRFGTPAEPGVTAHQEAMHVLTARLAREKGKATVDACCVVALREVPLGEPPLESRVYVRTWDRVPAVLEK